MGTQADYLLFFWTQVDFYFKIKFDFYSWFADKGADLDDLLDGQDLYDILQVPKARTTSPDSSCRLLIVPLFRGSSRFESLILSHHSRFTGECNKEDIDDDDDDDAPLALRFGLLRKATTKKSYLCLFPVWACRSSHTITRSNDRNGKPRQVADRSLLLLLFYSRYRS